MENHSISLCCKGMKFVIGDVNLVINKFIFNLVLNNLSNEFTKILIYQFIQCCKTRWANSLVRKLSFTGISERHES